MGFLTFEEAARLDFGMSEVDEAGSVPELLAFNALERNVLLYDGEEFAGAKQNHTHLRRRKAERQAQAPHMLGVAQHEV